MKTTREIINQTPKFDINDAKEKLDYNFNTRWFSEEEVLSFIETLEQDVETLRKTHAGLGILSARIKEFKREIIR